MLKEEDELPVFQVSKVASCQSVGSILVTLKVPSGNFIRFEIDTGARGNVLTVHIHEKATGDFEPRQVTPTKSSYDGGNIPVLGTVKLQVWRGSLTCLLLCRLVESKPCRPILGKTACEGMGVVEIKDSDAIRKPDTNGVKCFLSRMRHLVPILSPRSRSKRCFPMCSTKASVYWRASTISNLTIQSSQFNTLPGEVKLHFAVKSKTARRIT